MNVSCPDCASVFRVDPAKVPDAGVRARCSVCGGVMAIGKHGIIGDDYAMAAPAHPRHERAAGAKPPATPPRPASSVPQRPVTPRSVTTPYSVPVAPPWPASAPPASGRPSTPSESDATTHSGLAAAAASSAQRASSERAIPSSSVPSTGLSGRSTTAAPAPAVKAPVAPPATRPALQASAAPASAAAAAPVSPPPRRPINPFLTNDPNQKAKRLARALVSDIVAYFPDKRKDGLRNGTLKTLFREEIKKSYEEYVDQVGRDFAESTSHFRDALNDVLAGGAQVF